MAKDVDLLSYWMPLIRGLKEFGELAKAEEPELRSLLEAIDRTLNNMYIEKADEYGIKRFEDMMGIYPEAGSTLDTRRFNVMAKWNDKVPYTDNTLYNKLLALCGSADKFEIHKDYTNYSLEIITYLGAVGSYDTVASLMVEMIPCNLVLTLENILQDSKVTPLNIGVVTNTAMCYVITNDIASIVSKATPMRKAVVSSTANVKVITNDLSDRAVGNGNFIMANPVGTATVVTIQ